MKSLSSSPPHPPPTPTLSRASERISIQMHSIKSRFVVGPSSCVTFQPGNCTCRGSEGVKGSNSRNINAGQQQRFKGSDSCNINASQRQRLKGNNSRNINAGQRRQFKGSNSCNTNASQRQRFKGSNACNINTIKVSRVISIERLWHLHIHGLFPVCLFAHIQA